MEVIIKIGDLYYAGNVEGGDPKVIRNAWGVNAHVSKPYSTIPLFRKNREEAKVLGSQQDLVREFEKIIHSIRFKYIDVDFGTIEIINVEEEKE